MTDRLIRSAARRHGLAILFTAVLVPAAWADQEPRDDLLSFAHGAVPVAAIGTPDAVAVGMDQALRAIDGDPGGYVLTPKPGGPQTQVAFVFALPAPTVFAAFAVPNVLETPSPAQTFARTVTVSGSAVGPEGPFQILATATLATHASRGEATEFPVTADVPVRWVRLELAGGVQVERDRTFFEFSEIQGYGRQEAVPLSTAFSGCWRGRGVKMELRQESARVNGCYDADGELTGTVSGNLLQAVGQTRGAGIASSFVLSVGADGSLFGVASTNGAPFRLYAGAPAPTLRTACADAPVAPLGCGAIVHGIRFDFDSATIRPESAPLLDALAEGLQAAPATVVTVVGHTSSEGSDAYNDDLSQRRAAAVVAALAARGLAADRLAAEGRGERQPLADNGTEVGRGLNRRVEIECR